MTDCRVGDILSQKRSKTCKETVRRQFAFIRTIYMPQNLVNTRLKTFEKTSAQLSRKGASRNFGDKAFAKPCSRTLVAENITERIDFTYYFMAVGERAVGAPSISLSTMTTASPPTTLSSAAVIASEPCPRQPAP